MIELIIKNWEIIAGAFSAIVAYLGGLRTKKYNEKKENASALESMQKTYDTFVNDQTERYNELKEELRFLRDEYKSLRSENKELKKELREWERKYLTLKNEFEIYKEKNK